MKSVARDRATLAASNRSIQRVCPMLAAETRTTFYTKE